MVTHAPSFPMFARLREPASLRRGLAAGVVWGLSITVALAAISVWQCGAICIDETIATAVVSVAAGLVTMGPLAALGRRD